MITDKTIAALKSYLEANADGNLDDATVFERDDDADLSYPALIIREDGEPEQHGLLRNEWTVNLVVSLKTIPEDTTESAHQLMTLNLAELLGDAEAVCDAMNETIPTRGIYGGEGSTDAEDGYRISEFPLEAMVNSQRGGQGA